MLHKSTILIIYLLEYLFLVAMFTVYKQPLVTTIYLLPIIISLIFFWRVKTARYILLFLLVFTFSAWQLTSQTAVKRNNLDFTNQGFVSNEPKVSNYSQQILVDLDDGTRLSEFVPAYPSFSIGDRVEVEGNTIPVRDDPYYKKNPGYFLTRKIDYTGSKLTIKAVENNGSRIREYIYKIRRGLVEIRQKYESFLLKIIPEPYGGLAIGILLGSRSALSDNINNSFINIGIIHIIALSGYNITIIADNLRRLTKPISLRFSIYFALFGIWAFVFATGLSASVVRAAIMGSILLIARLLGRQADSFVAILLAAVIMVVINPYILIYDIGFQLSFTAMSGLLILGPRLSKPFRALGKSIGGDLAATISAQIFTLPLLLYYFGRFSLISILANMLVLPIIPMTMFVTFTVASTGFVSIWLAQKLGLLLYLLLGYILRVAETLGNLPGVSHSYSIGPVTLIGMYIILFELAMFLNIRQRSQNEKN